MQGRLFLVEGSILPFITRQAVRLAYGRYFQMLLVL